MPVIYVLWKRCFFSDVPLNFAAGEILRMHPSKYPWCTRGRWRGPHTLIYCMINSDNAFVVRKRRPEDIIFVILGLLREEEHADMCKSVNDREYFAFIRLDAWNPSKSKTPITTRLMFSFSSPLLFSFSLLRISEECHSTAEKSDHLISFPSLSLSSTKNFPFNMLTTNLEEVYYSVLERGIYSFYKNIL